VVHLFFGGGCGGGGDVLSALKCGDKKAGESIGQ
jgi:hypothetical protein